MFNSLLSTNIQYYKYQTRQNITTASKLEGISRGVVSSYSKLKGPTVTALMPSEFDSLIDHSSLRFHSRAFQFGLKKVSIRFDSILATESIF